MENYLDTIAFQPKNIDDTRGNYPKIIGVFSHAYADILRVNWPVDNNDHLIAAIESPILGSMLEYGVEAGETKFNPKQYYYAVLTPIGLLYAYTNVQKPGGHFLARIVKSYGKINYSEIEHNRTKTNYKYLNVIYSGDGVKFFDAGALSTTTESRFQGLLISKTRITPESQIKVTNVEPEEVIIVPRVESEMEPVTPIATKRPEPEIDSKLERVDTTVSYESISPKLKHLFSLSQTISWAVHQAAAGYVKVSHQETGVTMVGEKIKDSSHTGSPGFWRIFDDRDLSLPLITQETNMRYKPGVQYDITGKYLEDIFFLRQKFFENLVELYPKSAYKNQVEVGECIMLIDSADRDGDQHVLTIYGAFAAEDYRRTDNAGIRFTFASNKDLEECLGLFNVQTGTSGKIALEILPRSFSSYFHPKSRDLPQNHKVVKRNMEGALNNLKLIYELAKYVDPLLQRALYKSNKHGLEIIGVLRDRRNLTDFWEITSRE